VATRTKGRSPAPVGELVTSLNIEQLREVVSAAAERHADVERAVRLIAARENDDLAVRASGAIPLLSPMVEITTPRRARGHYIDGGTRLNSPIKPALELGADRVIVVGLEPFAQARTRPLARRAAGIADVAANVLDGLLVDQVAYNLRRLAVYQLVLRRERQHRAHALTPRYRFLLFDPVFVAGLIDMGRRDAARWLRRHPHFWCKDAAHDLSVAATLQHDRVSEQVALDEFRALRRH
jgi:predicted acylesterase/phospholipase RssA